MKKFFFFATALFVSASMMATQTSVAPGDSTLSAAIGDAAAGDTLALSTGVYNEFASITIDKNLVIMAGEDQAPVVNMAGQFELTDGDLALQGLKIDGTTNTSSYFLSVRGNKAMNILLDGCEIGNYPKYLLEINTKYHVDSVIINDCYIHDITRSIIYAYTNEDENNLAGCSYFEMTNSTAAYMKGAGSSVASIYIRNNNLDTGGSNAPKIVLDHVTMYSVLDPLGIIKAEIGAKVTIENSIINSSKSGVAALNLFNPGVVNNTLFYDTNKGTDALFTKCIEEDPQFVNPKNSNFQLAAESPAVGAGTDGSNLGDPRWGVAEPSGLVKVAEKKNIQKMVVNGQLMIVKDGKVYNVLGL